MFQTTENSPTHWMWRLENAIPDHGTKSVVHKTNRWYQMSLNKHPHVEHWWWVYVMFLRYSSFCASLVSQGLWISGDTRIASGCTQVLFSTAPFNCALHKSTASHCSGKSRYLRGDAFFLTQVFVFYRNVHHGKLWDQHKTGSGFLLAVLSAMLPELSMTIHKCFSTYPSETKICKFPPQWYEHMIESRQNVFRLMRAKKNADLQVLPTNKETNNPNEWFW